jgi:hypothetical protein
MDEETTGLLFTQSGGAMERAERTVQPARKNRDGVQSRETVFGRIELPHSQLPSAMLRPDNESRI